MKRVTIILLALILCLSLCGCGKSEAVKNVEAMIDAIGEVTLDSEAAVVAAEEAYAALTAEEKEKVENHIVLTDARAALDPMIEEHQERLKYTGEWVTIYGQPQYCYTLFEDGTLSINGDVASYNWLLIDNGLKFGTNNEWLYEEVDSIPRLVQADANGNRQVLVRKEFASIAEHEINIDNWQEYFDYERIYMPHYDPFGSFAGFSYSHFLILKAEYADRLVYEWSEGHQVAVEFSGTQLMAYGDLNQETGEFTIDRLSNNLVANPPVGTVDAWELVLYCLSNKYHPSSYPDEYPPNPPYTESGYVKDGYYEIFGYLENPGIGRIQGSLLFYDYPVHKQ